MTKEITKAYIIQEIVDKFKLRELTPEIFSFLETVVPIYNIDQHLEKWVAGYVEKSITSAAGFEFYTVPDNERWKLRRYDIVFMGAGAYTVGGAYTHRKAGGDVYLDLEAAQTISYHVDLVEPVVLQSGDSLRVLIDGYTSTAALRLYLDYVVEVLR